MLKGHNFAKFRTKAIDRLTQYLPNGIVEELVAELPEN
jgi:hypothetical protein